MAKRSSVTGELLLQELHEEWSEEPSKETAAISAPTPPLSEKTAISAPTPPPSQATVVNQSTINGEAIVSTQNLRRTHTRNLVAAVVGAQIVTVIQLLTLDKPNDYLLMAVLFFAISMPLLITYVVITYFESYYKLTFQYDLMYRFLLIGLFIAASGFFLVFYYFSPIIGICFAISAIVALFTVSRFREIVDRIPDQEDLFVSTEK